jgi:RNA-directed DNA polymerase
MSDKRQNNQLRLAFDEEGRSEAPMASCEGSETFTAKRISESPANHEQLMEEVCGRDNCLRALKRVKSNKGSPGIDGMTVDDLSAYLKEHWPAIREQLLAGTYKPQPVKRVAVRGRLQHLCAQPAGRGACEAEHYRLHRAAAQAQGQ